MKVMVTGGTGFVGYHTVKQLLAQGHKPRLLVRSESKMRKLFGDTIGEFVVGDVVDPIAIRECMQGCDAVVHSAAMVSIDRKDAQRVHDTNFGGTCNVMEQAIALELKKIIHVSSVTALYDSRAAYLDENSPPGTAESPYGKSKVASEIHVRELQAAGVPITITYPGSVIGPDDPALTEPHEGLKTFLIGGVPIAPTGNQWVDARDIAIAHQRILDSELPPSRYVLGGHYVPWRALPSLLQGVTGRRIRTIPLPGGLARNMGYVVDWLNRTLPKPIEAPMTHEAMVYATQWVIMNNSRAMKDLNLTFRPTDESLADAIRWLYKAGHINADQAGFLAE